MATKPSMAVSKVSAIKGLAKKAGKKEAVIFQQMMAECFMGPMPPPHLMKGYHEIDPSFPDRLLKIVEKEQDNRHKLESISLDKQFIERKRGQIFSLTIGVVGIISGVICAIKGAQWPGGVIGAGGIATLMLVFVWRGKNTKQ